MVKALVERLHQRYRVSVVESGFHDLHQRAEIALAALVGHGEASWSACSRRSAASWTSDAGGVRDATGTRRSWRRAR